MKVANYPNKLSNSSKTMVLGYFSTFHNGHLELLKEAQKYNEKIVFLIIDDKEKILNKKPSVHSLEVRLLQMANIGIDEVVVLRFNNEIKLLNGKDFLNKLKEIYKVKRFVVGKDFAIGKNASFKSKDILENFNSSVISEKKINENKISSSLMKEFLEFGDVELFKKCSPFYYTRDIKVDDSMCFKKEGIIVHNGIYAAWAIVNDIKYWSVISISSLQSRIYIPTLLIQNTQFNCQVEFVQKIRTSIKSSDSIKEEDKKNAIEILSNKIK